MQRSFTNSQTVSRVKKIVNVDPDVNICSNNAAFVITLAAEMFVQYLAQEGQNMAKTDRKPRRNLQYKDLGPFAPPPPPFLSFFLRSPPTTVYFLPRESRSSLAIRL